MQENEKIDTKMEKEITKTEKNLKGYRKRLEECEEMRGNESEQERHGHIEAECFSRLLGQESVSVE